MRKGGQWATDAFPQADRNGSLESLEGHRLPVGSPMRQGGTQSLGEAEVSTNLTARELQTEKPLPIEVRAGGWAWQVDGGG